MSPSEICRECYMFREDEGDMEDNMRPSEADMEGHSDMEVT